MAASVSIIRHTGVVRKDRRDHVLERPSYNWTTIGSLEDLQAASLEAIKDFFRQYYTARNTILVISGDLDEKQTEKWVKSIFGQVVG
ncbi:MAG: insulinase family protein [Acidobacteria bacterium]|nr:insulinase family protein [Acidobacteriota bacterium]